MDFQGITLLGILEGHYICLFLKIILISFYLRKVYIVLNSAFLQTHEKEIIEIISVKRIYNKF